MQRRPAAFFLLAWRSGSVVASERPRMMPSARAWLPVTGTEAGPTLLLVIDGHKRTRFDAFESNQLGTACHPLASAPPPAGLSFGLCRLVNCQRASVRLESSRPLVICSETHQRTNSLAPLRRGFFFDQVASGASPERGFNHTWAWEGSSVRRCRGAGPGHAGAAARSCRSP